MSYRILQACDAAYGESQRSDFTSIVTAARDLGFPTMKIHLLDVWQDRIPLEQVPAAIGAKFREWRPQWVGIENTLWQASIIQNMRRRGDVPFVEVDRRKARNPDKKTRAGSLAFHYSEGHIWHPRPAPTTMRLFDGKSWLEGEAALRYAEDQLLAFTGVPGRDDHDDFVDAMIDVCDALSLTASWVQQQGPVYHNMTWDAPQQRKRLAYA